MKQTVKNYSFNASAHTITFSDFSSISLERVYLVTNVTSNTLIYQFNNNALGGSVGTNILTLTYNTGSMSNTDKLQIIYDVASGDPVYDSGEEQVSLTDGTNVVNVLSGSGTAAGQNAQLVAGAYREMTSLSAGSLNALFVNDVDVSNYKWLSLQVDGTWSGTLSVYASNDNSNYYPMPVLSIQNTGNQLVNTITNNSIYVSPVQARYFQVKMTSYSSGTATGVLELYTSPTQLQTIGVTSTQNGGWTVDVNAHYPTGSGVPSNAFYQGISDQSGKLTGAVSANTGSGTTGNGLLGAGILAQYNSSAPTVSNGNYNVLQLDSSGNLKVNVTAGSGGSIELTDGTNTANILSSSGTAAGQNAQIVANQQPALSTATWTTSTSINTTLAQSCVGLGTATVTTVETGTTTTAGALTFEGYDGTNWWAINGQQIGSFTIQSNYTLVNATNVAWSFDIAGFQQFRVRLSTAITGTGSPQVVVILQTQAASNDIAPTVGLAQQLDSTNDSVSAWEKGATYTKITGSGTVVSGSCVFYGYTCEASSSGTLLIYDNTAASGNTMLGGTAVTLTAGTNVFLPIPIIMTTGVYATIGGSSATVNILTRSTSK